MTTLITAAEETSVDGAWWIKFKASRMMLLSKCVGPGNECSLGEGRHARVTREYKMPPNISHYFVCFFFSLYENLDLWSFLETKHQV